MACGCPVITSNVSSLPELLGVVGVLVDPYDVQQLVGAIERVLGDLTITQTMQKLGFEQAKTFSWERCARQTLSVYNQVLGL